MISTIKENWVKALRSGKYRQGKGRLRKGNLFCCLGVLCDLHDKTKWEMMDARTESYFYENTDNGEFIYTSLRDRLDLSYQQMIMLMSLNDRGQDFNYIADVIEKQF